MQTSELCIIIACEQLQQAVGESHAANHVVFYIFVGSWVISVSHLANEINHGSYYVKGLKIITHS